jgi:hypothetical protein
VLGDDAALGVQEDLRVSPVEGAVQTFLPSAQGEDLAVRTGLRVLAGDPGGLVMMKDGFAWAGPGGSLLTHSLKTGRTFQASSPRGPVERFAFSEDGLSAFVWAGGFLQRWNLASGRALVLTDERLRPAAVAAIEPLRGRDKPMDSAEIFFEGGRIAWAPGRVVRFSEADPSVGSNLPSYNGLRHAGGALFLQKDDGGTRLWVREYRGGGSQVSDAGLISAEVRSILPGRGRGVFFAAVPDGLAEWDARNEAWRVFPVEGLREAASGGKIRLDLSFDESAAILSAGGKVFLLELSGPRAYLGTEGASLRQWSQTHPMSVSGGALRIGEFSFPMAPKEPPRGWAARLRGWAMRRLGKAPADPDSLGISEKEWKALNLPTNKRVIYDTLKGFAMGQHVLYIGETGGGKTWLAEHIARLTGNNLWMASLNEYTRPKDLIARETFGEDGRQRTGLSLSTVLMWMQRKGVLLLDEIHKPLEGISVVNNILQNGVYRLVDGRVFRQDKERSWVIGTMNPVKPPYNGQPPSGELSSRFGLTLEVKYLPPDEEEALLKIFFPGVSRELVHKLVAAANDLRKAYPDILPLPIAPRTLMNVVEHVQRFPKDSPADIFRKTYNPATIVDDPSIQEAILKVLKAHGIDLVAAAPASEPPPMAAPAAKPPEPDDDQPGSRWERGVLDRMDSEN